MASNSVRAFSMPTRQFSGLRHCDPAWKVTPARSAPSLAAVAMISRASAAPAPNLPESGQSLPIFGVAMRRYRHAAGSTACMRLSSSTLSTTNQRTPFAAAYASASRERIGLEKNTTSAGTPSAKSTSSSAVDAISKPAPSCASTFSTRRSGFAFTACTSGVRPDARSRSRG